MPGDGFRARRRTPSAAAGLIAAGLCLVLAAGCATTARDRARTAELSENFDEAVLEYARAVEDRPEDRTLQRDLDRARLRAGQYHHAEGLRFAGLGNYEDALVEHQIAAELNPASNEIQEVLRETAERVRTRRVARRAGQTGIEALIERTRFLPPDGLELPDGVLPDSLVFRDASTRDVFTALGLFSDVNVVFDPAFVDQRISVDLRGARLRDALASVTRSSQNFYRVTAPRTVTVIPDTTRQAERVRGGDRSDLLSEQRRSRGDRRPAPPRPGHAPAVRGHRHPVPLDPGHAGADCRRGPAHRRRRQGAARGRDRC